jgi:hypothetical protein
MMTITMQSLAATESPATVRPGQGATGSANVAPEASQVPSVDLYQAIQYLSLAKTLELAASANCSFGALL